MPSQSGKLDSYLCFGTMVPLFIDALWNTIQCFEDNVPCLVQGFQFKSLDDQILLNDNDSPILELTKAVSSTPGAT